MILRTIVTLIVIFTVSNNVIAGDLLWPTNASNFITSSFAEYRPGHFHAGIDIKTWNREGYSVFAIDDGYIWQIRVSPFGYGKVLYQKLRTGETVVYAHLKKFSDDIEQIVKQEQMRQGEYRVNLSFAANKLPVHQGDVIAYTGATGIGKPHLHFEIRDFNNYPMNPFLLGYKIADTVPPGISGLSVTPLNAESRVNFDVKQAIYRPVQFKHGEYEIRQPIILYGSIGFAIDCWDKANGINNVFAVYRVNFYVDGQLKFSSVYNKFSYDVSGLIDLDRDYRLNKRGVGLFQKLYIEQGNTLPFYKSVHDDTGIIYCEPADDTVADNGRYHHKQPYNFLIEVFDFNGNMTSLRGEFQVAKKLQIFTQIEKDDHDDYYITDVFDENGNSISNMNLFLLSTNGRNWIKYQYDFENDQFEVQSHRYPLKIKNHLQIIKVVAEDMSGNETFPQFAVVAKEPFTYPTAVDFLLAKDFYDDYVRLELSIQGFLRQPPRMFVQQTGMQPMEVDLIQYEFNQFFGVYKLISGKDGPVDIETYAQDFSGKEVMHWDQFDVHTISPQDGGQVLSKDGKCEVKFKAGSVYKDLFLQLNNNENEADKIDSNKYEIVGAAYDIEPNDVPLKNNVHVYLQIPDDDPAPDKLGIYGKEKTRRNNWSFIGNDLDRVKNTVSARLSGLKQVTLIRDTEPPEIRILFPVNQVRTTRRQPQIKVRVNDRLSGLADDRSIVLKLDGRKVISEYDPEEKTVAYKVEDALDFGEHEVSVTAVDNCGNEYQVVHKFTVVSRQN